MQHYLRPLLSPESIALVGGYRGAIYAVKTSAEFAVVVGDAWQRRGIARVLMRGLIVCAKRRGFERLRGTILHENEPMLAFARGLGFVLEEDPADATQICATLALSG